MSSEETPKTKIKKGTSLFIYNDSSNGNNYLTKIRS